MDEGQLIRRGIVCAVIVATCLILSFSSCATVPAGYVGVMTTFGRVHDKTLEPGIHFKRPFMDGVVRLDTRLISYEVDASSASRDLQVVRTVISVQHSLRGDTAAQSYEKIGDLHNFDIAVVSPAVLESLKAVTAKYTAEELITKREIVKNQTVEAIQRFIDQTLNDKELPGALHVVNVAIKDFEFSPGFNASIESKVKAQQEALRAENEKTKRITDAEAAARERELAADAEAYEIEKLSVQRATAIEREAKAVAQNPLLLQLRAIERWDGSVPRFTGGSQMVPFVNVEGMLQADDDGGRLIEHPVKVKH